MPLPLSHLTMEAIALVVDKWRKGELPAREAVSKIGKMTIDLQKVEWELEHRS